MSVGGEELWLEDGRVGEEGGGSRDLGEVVVWEGG